MSPTPLLDFLHDSKRVVRVDKVEFGDDYPNFTQIFRNIFHLDDDAGRAQQREEMEWNLDAHKQMIEHTLLLGRKDARKVGGRVIYTSGGLADFFDLKLAVRRGRGTRLITREECTGHTYEYLTECGLWIGRKGEK